MTNGPIKKLKKSPHLGKKSFSERIRAPENRRSTNVIDKRISTARDVAKAARGGAKRHSREADARLDIVEKGMHGDYVLDNRTKLLHTQVAVREVMAAARSRAIAKKFEDEANRIAQNYKDAAARKRNKAKRKKHGT